MRREIIKSIGAVFILSIMIASSALAQKPQVNILAVSVDFDAQTMTINGENFNIGPNPTTASLGGFGNLNIISNDGSTIVAELPPGISAGDYTLFVSSGPGPKKNDQQSITIGAQGPEGDMGDPGTPGDPGDQGPQGPQGGQGPQGPQGPTGATGPQGPIGLTGPAGQDGTNGVDGTDGLDGLSCWDTNGNGIGDPDEDINTDGNYDTLDCIGPQGVAGVDGQDGAPGVDGAVGPEGPQGPQGPTGATGPQGPVGPPGLPGPAGADGQDGMDGTDGLACWDLNGDGAGTPNEDTNEDGNFNTLDCIGPEGPEGDRGPRGDSGPQGPQGDQGIQGLSGLRGADGATGPQGIQGLSGFDGATGPQGDPGTSNYTRSNNAITKNFAEGEAFNRDISCSGSQKIISGGCNSGNADAVVFGSYPVSDTTWRCKFVYTAPLPPITLFPVQINVYTICADVN